jgi:hypothetical protein
MFLIFKHLRKLLKKLSFFHQNNNIKLANVNLIVYFYIHKIETKNSEIMKNFKELTQEVKVSAIMICEFGSGVNPTTAHPCCCGCEDCDEAEDSAREQLLNMELTEENCLEMTDGFFYNVL